MSDQTIKFYSVAEAYGEFSIPHQAEGQDLAHQ